MFLDKPLGCELGMIAGGYFIIKGYLHNLPSLCVFTSVFHEKFESIEVMNGTIHHSSLRHDFLMRPNQQENDKYEL
jgi:hypothetical protein